VIGVNPVVPDRSRGGEFREFRIVRFEKKGVAHFVANDGIEVIGLAGGVPGDPPVVVALRQEPAQGVVVSLGLHFDSARSLELQFHAAARLESAGGGRLPSRAEGVVMNAVDVEEESRVGETVRQMISGIEPVLVPDPGRFRPGPDFIQVHVADEISPVPRGLQDDVAPGRPVEKARFILGKFDGDIEGGGPVQVLIDDRDRDRLSRRGAARPFPGDAQGILLGKRIAVREYRDEDRLPVRGAFERNGLPRAGGAAGARQVEIEARPVRGKGGLKRENSPRGRPEKNLHGRIGQVSFPVDERDPAGIQRPSEYVLDDESIRLAERGPAQEQ